MLEQLLFQAVQKTSDSIIVVDHLQKILYVNEGTLKSFHYIEIELIGQPLNILLPAQKTVEHQLGVTQFLHSPQHEINMGNDLSIYGKTKEGSLFPALARVTKVEQDGAFYMAVFVKDISEIKLTQEKTFDQVRRLNAIRKVDAAITRGNNLNSIFEVVLDEVINQLGVNAACILQFNESEQMLEFAAGKGFITEALRFTRLALGDGHAGQAALLKKVISISDLRIHQSDFLRSPWFESEKFVTYYAVPLIVKDRIMGVLEVFFRSPKNPDADWFNFLESLADQAAIALENSKLFYDLKQVNKDLVNAYDETIEGWSHALDLRDHETEGHTQRVTEMTLKLARLMNFPEADMVHLRRGALLHDIGKMGVPDRILLKPAKLTKEEMVIMQQHPTLSYEMLYPIAYLRPALDIPYCHHEKWDGSGYPRGLKGEEIPLAARIFACVDVWDALCSDRPYRPAWGEEKVREYMHSLSGIHFDPHVLPYFFKLVADEGADRSM